MAHDIGKHISAAVLDKLVEPIGKIQSPSFRVALLELLNQLRDISESVAKAQALFCPIRDRYLAPIEPPTESLIFPLIGHLQQPSPERPFGCAAEPASPQPP